VNSSSLNGIVLVFTGIVIAGLGFLPISLASLSLAGNACYLIVGSSTCAESRGIVAIGYYQAIAGSALATIGVWQTGIARGRIVREGSSLVIAIGLIILLLGFLAFSTLPSATSVGYFFENGAAIGYFFGLLGSMLLMWGMVKMRMGESRVSSAGRT